MPNWQGLAIFLDCLLIKQYYYSTRACWIGDDYSQLDATCLFAMYHLISNARSWNNCFKVALWNTGHKTV